MIFRLIVLTINTGLWTAVFAILVLGLVRILPPTVKFTTAYIDSLWTYPVQYIPYQNELIYTALDFPLTSLYLNSLLANLNAREYVRGAKSDVECNSYGMAASQTAVFRNPHATVATYVRGWERVIALMVGHAG